jgi:hypothetical protein
LIVTALQRHGQHDEDKRGSPDAGVQDYRSPGIARAQPVLNLFLFALLTTDIAAPILKFLMRLLPFVSAAIINFVPVLIILVIAVVIMIVLAMLAVQIPGWTNGISTIIALFPFAWFGAQFFWPTSAKPNWVALLATSWAVLPDPLPGPISTLRPACS